MAALSVYAAGQASVSRTGSPMSTTAITVTIDAGTATTAGHGTSSSATAYTTTSNSAQAAHLLALAC